MDKLWQKDLEKQGYRIVGNHSAVKPCHFCKQAIREKDQCYKSTFYGLDAARCLQMSTAVMYCEHRCNFCWRQTEHFLPKFIEEADDPKFILEESIKAHQKLLEGFKGNKKVNQKRVEESMEPKHVAMSLTGESTMYPLLPEFVEEVHKKNMTSFIVTNGMQPEMVKKLIKVKPTQFYLTLPAPDKETYEKVCKPVINDGWKRLMETLDLMKEFDRSTIRLTVAKNDNYHSPEKYAELIKRANPKFVEVKSAMAIGYARYKITHDDMISHEDIKKFAQEIADYLGWKIIAEKENSRVVLLMKEDSKDRIIKWR